MEVDLGPHQAPQALRAGQAHVEIGKAVAVAHRVVGIHAGQGIGQGGKRTAHAGDEGAGLQPQAGAAQARGQFAAAERGDGGQAGAQQGSASIR
ncbi:hypothetical protein G4G28_24040 [Massilia sp. Dwa41.01b]|uniref:hypothetical protein n=1 Tax=Massilia sp. Dwa41.01b TaxID=2709302 RepID=UPI001862C339|nr:hypothetical protein [Massilia sp. Dwa41.01b]QNA87238.1 hypothetical protein G4G28_24040 [Massilia sp. Dwa41.01b]